MENSVQTLVKNIRTINVFSFFFFLVSISVFLFHIKLKKKFTFSNSGNKNLCWKLVVLSAIQLSAKTNIDNLLTNVL